jgi:hypothetical protein
MAERLVLRLHNAQQGHGAIQQAWAHAKGWLLAGGQRLVLEIKPETRSDKQNRLLHAMLGDIAAQVEWAGAKRDAEVWKRLLVAAWCRARREQVELLPALDGHGVDIVFRRTSQLTRGECAELCDFIGAWCAENGVELREARQWVDAETGEVLA